MRHIATYSIELELGEQGDYIGRYDNALRVPYVPNDDTLRTSR